MAFLLKALVFAAFVCTAAHGELRQITNHVMMVRPAAFDVNPETAASNAFQKDPELSAKLLARKARDEFDSMVLTLRRHGVQVHVFDDTVSPWKPDAVFPNNWITFHHDGRVVVYPMNAPSRRLERRMDIVATFQHRPSSAFDIKDVVDLSHFEADNMFLEGTGSMVIDHVSRVIYACLSPRTHQRVLDAVGELLGYSVLAFRAVDAHGKEIYHTNVLMAIGDRFAVICTDCIPDPEQRKLVETALRSSGHEIVSITFDQLNHFAGNVLQLMGKRVLTREDSPIVVMSQTAYDAFTPTQRQILQATGGELVPVSIPTIEHGGGSARCMIAEIFAPTTVRSRPQQVGRL